MNLKKSKNVFNLILTIIGGFFIISYYLHNTILCKTLAILFALIAVIFIYISLKCLYKKICKNSFKKGYSYAKKENEKKLLKIKKEKLAKQNLREIS